MSSDESQSVDASVAALVPRHRRTGKALIEDIVEVSSKETHSETLKIGGSVTSRRRWAQIILDDSPTKVSNIPEDEDEEALCSSGSVGFLDLGLLAGEAIPEISSDEDDIDEVYWESEYREYITSYPY